MPTNVKEKGLSFSLVLPKELQGNEECLEWAAEAEKIVAKHIRAMDDKVWQQMLKK